MSLRKPGEPREQWQAPRFGHCLGCHRGVFLATVEQTGPGEPCGYCERCEANESVRTLSVAPESA